MTSTSPQTRRPARQPADARAHNTALALSVIFRGGPLSRADIARETGLTRVTASTIVGELVSRRILVELEAREPTGRGKPATPVDIDREGLCIVVVDASPAAHLTGAIIDLRGEIVRRLERARPDDVVGDAAVEAIADLARELIGSAAATVVGVGVASPGVISPAGIVRQAPNLGWAELPLRERLADELGLPVSVANDANLAALAEHTLADGSPDMLLLRVGHGIGAGLLVHGRLVGGAHDAAGEIGHVTMSADEGPLCACGKRGCLEAWVAIPPLAASVAASADPRSVLREAGERIGLGIAPVVAALDLGEVVIATSSGLYGADLLDAARATLDAHTFRAQTAVRMSRWADDGVLRGAFAQVLADELGIA
ncbi:ROK family transcriptional regulator [Microbacterium indicum]|uniref:ROK family transcriptional regulator n=1 Tax=Microbacterium indicum TaxID=358100 RepID=UPI000429FC11|nr:ROK family transcriptional regulator [Microbacterium indicum]